MRGTRIGLFKKYKNDAIAT